MTTTPAVQDAQVFKERCEDSPGVLVLCQGDWLPTPERVRLFEETGYYVMTAANGYRDILDWLPQARCIGGMFAHPDSVSEARRSFPDKVIERFEGVGERFLRTLTQELPYGLHNAGLPFDTTTPATLKTVDVVSVFSPVALKRGQLLIDALLAAGATAYLFAQSLGSDSALLQSFLDSVSRAGRRIDFFHYPFDPYGLIRLDGRIVIDGRPIGANNCIVPSYLARARLYVHTSTTEGLSNSVMEALLSDVPVVLCDDIRGPLQELSQELAVCFRRAPPDAAALAGTIRALLAAPSHDGRVRAAFRAAIDPFEVNRRVVRGVQAWFARHDLPGKGHCLGLMGGVQSRLDVRDPDGEAAYRGQRHIYPDPAGAARCAAFQRRIADATGTRDHAATLLEELRLMGAAPPAAAEVEVDPAAFERTLLDWARQADLTHVVLTGAGAWRLLDRFVTALAGNPRRPVLYGLEDSASRYATLTARYGDRPELRLFHAGSLPSGGYPAPAEVEAFYRHAPHGMGGYPLAEILGWRAAEMARLDAECADRDGLRTVSEAAGTTRFSCAIVDGSEFAGGHELERLYGADILVLGCTRTFKNLYGLHRLRHDPSYVQVMAAPRSGNGSAAFVRQDFLQRGGLRLDAGATATDAVRPATPVA
jgi:Glycosyl transferases group 1